MNIVLWFRKTFLATVQPVIKWLGKTHVPTSVKVVKDSDLEACIAIWRPGDILLSYVAGQATDLIIAGPWRHAALVVDSKRVLQSTADGVHLVMADDFFLTKDAVCLLRPKFATPEQSSAALAWALSQVGKPYDYQLSPGLAAFYCSELVYDSYAETLSEACPLKTHEVLDVPVYEPSDFFNDKANMQLLYNSETDQPASHQC